MTCNDCGRDINDCDRYGCREIRGVAWAGKANCVPIAGENYNTIADRVFQKHMEACTVPPSPSKRDATEVRRYQWNADLRTYKNDVSADECAATWIVEMFQHDAIVAELQRDHAAAIARVEAELHKSKQAYTSACAVNRLGWSIARDILDGEEEWLVGLSDYERAEHHRIADLRAEREDLRSQLALQAEKVGRMREALEAIKAFNPGDFRPLADEIKIYQLADAALKDA